MGERSRQRRKALWDRERVGFGHIQTRLPGPAPGLQHPLTCLGPLLAEPHSLYPCSGNASQIAGMIHGLRKGSGLHSTHMTDISTPSHCVHGRSFLVICSHQALTIEQRKLLRASEQYLSEEEFKSNLSRCAGGTPTTLLFCPFLFSLPSPSWHVGQLFMELPPTKRSAGDGGVL